MFLLLEIYATFLWTFLAILRKLIISKVFTHLWRPLYDKDLETFKIAQLRHPTGNQEQSVIFNLSFLSNVCSIFAFFVTSSDLFEQTWIVVDHILLTNHHDYKQTHKYSSAFQCSNIGKKIFLLPPIFHAIFI